MRRARNGARVVVALQINALHATRRYEDGNHPTGTQPYASSDDNISMNSNTGPDTLDVYGAPLDWRADAGERHDQGSVSARA
jgi:hypothetical protein